MTAPTLSLLGGGLGLSLNGSLVLTVLPEHRPHLVNGQYAELFTLAEAHREPKKRRADGIAFPTLDGALLYVRAYDAMYAAPWPRFLNMCNGLDPSPVALEEVEG